LRGTSLEDGYSYIVSMWFRLQFLDDGVVPGCSAKLVKTLCYLVPQLEIVRKLYDSRDRIKPFSVTPLMKIEGGSQRVLMSSRSWRARRGDEFVFRISVAVRDLDELSQLQGVDEVVSPRPGTKVRIVSDRFEILSPDALRMDLEPYSIVRIRFLTPTLLSSKLMAPPLPQFLSKVRNVRSRYVLYPSSAHICCYLTKLWNKLFPQMPVSRKLTEEWSAYFMGRLCEVTMVTMDLGVKPVTLSYDVRRKVRGFVGWALYELCLESRKVLEKVGRLLALANVMGVGKTRSMGFGMVEVEKVPRREE